MTYNFDEIINRKGTFSTQWDYIQDRFGVSDLLPFSISDTDFRMPYEVQEAIAKFNELGIYGYTRWNHDTFKKAICGHFERRMGTVLNPDEIVYSPSVLYTISILLRELATKQKSVLAFSPMYDSFYMVVEENNLQLIESSLVERDGHFEIDFADLEEKMQQADVFLLCSPQNPTGRLWTYEELEQIVKLCKKFQVALISDEIHMDVNLTKRRHLPILTFYTQYQNMYLISSASKTFNTPGLIGSYAIIPDETMRERFFTIQKRRDFLNSASTLGMLATVTAYNESQKYIDELIPYIDQNLSYVEKFIQEKIPEFKYRKAEATYLAWIDCREMPWSMDELQEAFVKIGKIGVMSGKIYGNERYLRMNCGASLSKIRTGLDAMLKSVSYLREQ
ncbi:MAG: aminotransferase class I/II-fold pyridoxal phosphate-dependent enzyme [Streptococcaceae bacterium]|jgi:cystathionine beta-lyase|nr:aminotransferase class I/II-fold pyridoxal phosphate-dependent enzyme [Streptococcaceae bacterium]